MFQVCVPGTGKPLANIWDVNHWIALRRQERFVHLFGADGGGARLVASETQDRLPETNPGRSVLDGMTGEIGFK